MQNGIRALTETGLRDNEHAVNYAQISGYNLEINNRNTGQHGGGVGRYIKNKITYKRRQDIINIENTVEHLLIEARGTNKNNPYLMGTLWLEKFENIISQISIKWDDILFPSGDKIKL